MNKYTKNNRNIGIIIVIAVLAILIIVGVLSAFFIAKSIGYNNARNEFYDSRYEEGKKQGYDDGYREGYETGKKEGFSQGYNDPHCVYSGNGQKCRLLPVGQYY